MLAISLDKLDPNIGASTGGTMVTMSGSNFTGADKVTFAGVGALFRVISDAEIDVISPPNPVGPAGVMVFSAVSFALEAFVKSHPPLGKPRPGLGLRRIHAIGGDGRAANYGA